MKMLLGLVPIVLLSSVGFAAGVTSSDPKAVAAGTYVIDASHVGVSASVNHLGFSNTVVRFDKVTGSVSYNPANPEASTADVTVETASLNSGWAARDGHLKSKDFFNIEAFPTVKFKAEALVPTGTNTADMPGKLTLLGVTKPITFKVQFRGVGKGFDPAIRIGFAAKATIKRSDFGMGTYLPLVGDEAIVTVDVEFVKQP